MGVMKRIAGRRMFDPQIAGKDSESRAMRKVLKDQNRPAEVRKPPKQERRKNKAAALAVMDWIIKEAGKLALDVQYTYREHGGTLHIMFNSEGRRVLDWWPATGTTSDFKHFRQVAETPDEAITQARAAVDKMPEAPIGTVTGPEYDPNANDGTCPFDAD